MSDLDGIPSNTGPQNSEPLTVEMLREAMQKVYDEDYHAGQAAHAENAAKLMEATPEHLRSHPFIVNLTTAIGNGAIFHPEDARRAREEWERLCRE